jgi:peptide/nickel transport system permease protein
MSAIVPPGLPERLPHPPSGMGPDGLAVPVPDVSAPDRPPRTFRHDAWRRFRANKLAIFGLVLVALIVLLGLIGPFFVQDPYVQDPTLYRSPPDAQHWLGTDQIGRDTFARVVHGIRLSLFVGFTATAGEMLIGISVGAVAGWSSRFIDTVFMRIVDVLLAIPYFILAFALIAVVGRGISAVIVTLAVTAWLTTARVLRGSVLQAKQYEYVEAARAVGVGSPRIIWRHILPNVIQPIIVLAAIAIGTAVLAEAALSFLGLGVQEPTPSLGLMIARSRSFFSTAPWLLFGPGIAIMMTVLGFLLVGDGLRDALDVKEA